MRKTRNLLPFTEIRNFCPTENKKFSVPFKSGKFEGYETGRFLPLNMENKKFSMPFKTRSFEGNRKFLR